MLKPKASPADTMADLIPVSDVLRSPAGDYTLLTDGTYAVHLRVQPQDVSTTRSAILPCMARISKKALKERAAEVVRRLDALYPNAESELDYTDPFTLMVAVALSAQTTDINVNKVTPVLFSRWPDAHALAGASLDEVEEVVHSLGFFRSKAKAIVGASQRLVAEYDGVVPADVDELQTLPGVGRKTANIIMNQGFGKAVGIAVDTHVFRIAHLLGLTKAKTPDGVEKDLCDLIDEKDWGLVNHQLVLHGRRVCIARRPRCPECVLADICPSANL